MSIKAKVTIAYTIVFGVMLVLFAYLVYGSSRDGEVARLDALLGNHALKLVTEAEEQITEQTFPSRAEFLQISPDGLIDAHFRLFAPDSSLMLTDSVLASLPVKSEWPLERILNGFQNVELHGLRWRMHTVPVEVNDRVAFVLQVASSLTGVDANLQHLLHLFFLVIPLGLLVASAAAYGITRAAFRPLASMMATAGSIPTGTLDSRLELPEVHDEIWLLGETLNGMLQRIHDAFKAQHQFIADASHEIRTPLTIIQSELEYLRRQDIGRRMKDGLRVSLGEVQRLVRMTDGLLVLSKLDAERTPPEMQRVRIDETVIESVKAMQTLFRRKHQTLTLQIQEAAEILGDEKKLKQVTLNLLDNASKYAGRNGKVSVRLSVVRGEQLPVCLEIEDSGCGIAAKDLPHIFRRFYRAENSRGDSMGSGLGLAITEQLVKMHGGTITVRSEENRGSVFTVRLPLRA